MVTIRKRTFVCPHSPCERFGTEADDLLSPSDRRGTFVDPDYQKKGLGTRLTKYCNDIADRAGARTVVPATKNSVQMFKSNEFVVKEEFHVDLEPYTGRKGLEDFWLLIREPPSSSK